MVIANIRIPLLYTDELASVIKKLGADKLHCNVKMGNTHWEIEVTEP